MANLDNIVTVSIVVQDASVSQAGFGTPLVMTHESPFGPELVRIYTSTADMISDGFSATGATVAAVNAIFAQQPKVTQVLVGRRTSTATAMTRVMTVKAAPPADTDFTVTINGTAFTVDSGGSPTPVTVAALLVAAINGGAEPVTATDNLDGTFDLVEDVAGTIFGLTYSFTLLESDDTTTDAGVAADYAAIKLENSDFYGVAMTSSATLEIEALATAVEADKKIFGANSQDSDILANTGGNLFETLATAALNRTFGIYNLDNLRFAGAAYLGDRLPSTPGSSTWAFKTLSAVFVDPLTNTQISNIETNDGNHYTVTGGVNITLQGTMASGRFIDITRGIDFIDARLQAGLFGQLVNSEKIPFTNIGVGSVENIVRSVMAEGVRLGILAEDPAPTVTVPNVNDPTQVTQQDRIARTLNGVVFSAQLAGAIHAISVSGFVSP
ncbi:MAG: DUF3383 domain-containing protein [Gammaproteobacteria bacterium]|nr:DUF3383 domain-containing protein [Gammaproteobacteria bacterium]